MFIVFASTVTLYLIVAGADLGSTRCPAGCDWRVIGTPRTQWWHFALFDLRHILQRIHSGFQRLRRGDKRRRCEGNVLDENFLFRTMTHDVER